MNKPKNKTDLNASLHNKEQQKAPEKALEKDPYLRPPNEDDDGYDPYSDRIVREKMWEEDPWK